MENKETPQTPQTGSRPLELADLKIGAVIRETREGMADIVHRVVATEESGVKLVDADGYKAYLYRNNTYPNYLVISDEEQPKKISKIAELREEAEKRLNQLELWEGVLAKFEADNAKNPVKPDAESIIEYLVDNYEPPTPLRGKTKISKGKNDTCNSIEETLPNRRAELEQLPPLELTKGTQLIWRGGRVPDGWKLLDITDSDEAVMIEYLGEPEAREEEYPVGYIKRWNGIIPDGWRIEPVLSGKYGSLVIMYYGNSGLRDIPVLIMADFIKTRHNADEGDIVNVILDKEGKFSVPYWKILVEYNGCFEDRVILVKKLAPIE